MPIEDINKNMVSVKNITGDNKGEIVLHKNRIKNLVFKDHGNIKKFNMEYDRGGGNLAKFEIETEEDFIKLKDIFTDFNYK